MSKEIAGQADNADKPRGYLDINDMEIAGNLLAWLVLEGIVGTKNLCYKHVGPFSDNKAEISWTQIGAVKKSTAAGRLLRVLYLRQRVSRMSPFEAAHEAGDLNILGNIPSC